MKYFLFYILVSLTPRANKYRNVPMSKWSLNYHFIELQVLFCWHISCLKLNKSVTSKYFPNKIFSYKSLYTNKTVMCSTTVVFSSHPTYE